MAIEDMLAVNEHLLRCVELAEEALAAGDAPFGSVLVDAQGKRLREDRNRVNSRDKTYHPEIELVRWAAQNLSLEARRQTIMYTSGEHCPMCAAAHGWAELGEVIYIHATEHLVAWHQALGLGPSRVNQLPIKAIVPKLKVTGPVEDLLPRMQALHQQYIRQRSAR